MTKSIQISSITLLILLLNIIESDSQFGWFPLNTGRTETFQSVCFPSPKSGWAAGYNGVVINTTNAGTNWTFQLTPTSQLLNSIFFIDNSTGWAVGQSGAIISTTNSGMNWSAQTSSTTQILYCVFFINHTTGWITGYSGTILNTTNGGTNWIPQNSGVYSYLRSIYFIDLNTGIAVGQKGEMLRTTNSGLIWTELTNPGTSTLYDVYFKTPAMGYAGGLGSVRTTDGGVSWLPMQGFGIFGIFFTSLDTGWDCGFDGFINYTTNSGVNWIADNYNTSNWFYAVQFTSRDTGYICGDNGMILKTTDGGGLITRIHPESTGVPTGFNLFQNYPNPFNPSTTIRFDIALSPLSERGVGGFTSLKIYDILGREVATLVNQQLQPGSYSIEWNSTNYPSGVYFYKLVTGNYTSVKKMILIK